MWDLRPSRWVPLSVHPRQAPPGIVLENKEMSPESPDLQILVDSMDMQKLTVPQARKQYTLDGRRGDIPRYQLNA